MNIRTRPPMLNPVAHDEATPMTDVTRILLVQARTPAEQLAGERPRIPLGQLVRKSDGWHFHPMIAGRQHSRKGKPTWEAAIPRWTGGLDRTESRRMAAGEPISAVLGRF
jgi:hypothetical protein